MIKITTNPHQKSSGIPHILSMKNAVVIINNLVSGDYLINDSICIERKTAEDFVKSLINNKLFEQCLKLKKASERTIMIIEGSPYNTRFSIDRKAVRGALLSILVNWQIPAILSKSIDDTADIIMLIANQSAKQNSNIRLPKGFKHNKNKNQQLRFLQGMPCAGPTLAGRLYDHFENIKSVFSANPEEFRKIKGLGKKNTDHILEFINKKFE